MGAISSAVKHMLAAGMDADAIVRAIEDMEAAVPACRARLAPGRTLGIPIREWQDLRESVFRRDGYVCVYCGTDVSGAPQCDHVIPLAKGGLSAIDNLVTSCKSCNSSKRDRSANEWMRA